MRPGRPPPVRTRADDSNPHEHLRTGRMRPLEPDRRASRFSLGAVTGTLQVRLPGRLSGWRVRCQIARRRRRASADARRNVERLVDAARAAVDEIGVTVTAHEIARRRGGGHRHLLPPGPHSGDSSRQRRPRPSRTWPAWSARRGCRWTVDRVLRVRRGVRRAPCGQLRPGTTPWRRRLAWRCPIEIDGLLQGIQGPGPPASGHRCASRRPDLPRCRLRAGGRHTASPHMGMTAGPRNGAKP